MFAVSVTSAEGYDNTDAWLKDYCIAVVTKDDEARTQLFQKTTLMDGSKGDPSDLAPLS